MTLDEAVQRLARETRRVDPTKGRVAQRNARTAVLKELRNVRKALNHVAPACTLRKSTTRRAALTCNEVQKRGWHWVSNDMLITSLLKAGVRVRSSSTGGMFVKQWAMDLWQGQKNFTLPIESVLRRARTDITFRRAQLARLKLLGRAT